MALQQSFIYDLLHSTATLTSKTSSFSLTIPQRLNLYDVVQNKQFKKQGRSSSSCCAIAENLGAHEIDNEDQSVLLGDSSLEELRGQREIVGYDWTEEWYPLYLTNNVPDDAPLGLTVFDKQVVLLAKLSEGQLYDGKLECLYHSWQFEGDGKCVKIPQLPENAKIPRSACAKTHKIRDSQGVVWIWMEDFRDISTIHELPYDHSILLENLMDPAHVPISHDRTDFTAKREDAGPLFFEVTERTNRGFAGWWDKEKDQGKANYTPNFLHFEAPCVLHNSREIVDESGEKHYFSGLFLCRPSGQRKSMLIVQFGNTRKRTGILKFIPNWFLHQNASKVFEQDMGFLSSQNEILMKEKVPTKKLYLNLKSFDTWVAEYRKWMDKVRQGMPYHFGHSTIFLPQQPAVVEHAPAGLVANCSAAQPAKGGIGGMYAPNPANRYFRHVIHCRDCSNVVKAFETWKKALSVIALVSTAFAILVSGRQWKALFLVSTSLCLAGAYACSTAIAMNTTNFIRTYRRL
ncbi:unnamed protein product [Withania somnifera]